jgi:hypothetical protein
MKPVAVGIEFDYTVPGYVTHRIFMSDGTVQTLLDRIH